MATAPTGTAMTNGSQLQGMDPAAMGAVDPMATAPAPHIETPGMEPPMQEAPEQEYQPDQLRKFLESTNIAEDLDEDKLLEIAQECRRGFENDLDSRTGWDQAVEGWLKLASQVTEEKSFPWPRSANIKYPMISTAAMQFSARAYPSLIPADGKIVKTQVVGKDPQGTKKDKADRVSTYMSWQLLREMEGWEEDMDRMLMSLSIVGMQFKKTYFDPIKKKNCSHSVSPMNLVVNYWTRCLEDAERISEIIPMSPRNLKDKQRGGVFLDVDLGTPVNYNFHNDTEYVFEPRSDDTTPYEIIEQHTFLDLNDDGYTEPYIVTFDRNSGHVLRITARFDNTGIYTNEEGDVVKIDPIQYYTKFSFIPNPDGSFYDIGFGHLLGPLNDSVNTLINQLVDAGTLNNMQSGFIGKGLRLKMGETRFIPGEWKAVNATGDDLKKQIVPLPSKEPSNVLFQLMGALVTSGKELASVAEIFVGKMPGQNTPATTTMASIEQGMKVFTAVYKRVYRSLESEFKKLFRLNEVYLDYDTYVNVLDIQVDPSDFDSTSYDLFPGADPSAISQSEKLVKAQALVELLPLGTLDPLKVTIRLMEAIEVPNWEDVLAPNAGQPQQEQPDPQMLALQAQVDAKEREAQSKMQNEAFKSELAARDQAFKQQMEEAKTANDIVTKRETMRSQLEYDRAKNQQNQARANEQHQARMRQQAEQHQQRMKQSNEQRRASSASARSTTTRGKPKK